MRGKVGMAIRSRGPRTSPPASTRSGAIKRQFIEQKVRETLGLDGD